MHDVQLIWEAEAELRYANKVTYFSFLIVTTHLT